MVVMVVMWLLMVVMVDVVVDGSDVVVGPAVYVGAAGFTVGFWLSAALLTFCCCCCWQMGGVTITGIALLRIAETFFDRPLLSLWVAMKRRFLWTFSFGAVVAVAFVTWQFI